MSNTNNAAVTASFVRYEDDASLVGRRFQAADGVCVVLDERTPGGMYIVQRPASAQNPNGWKQAMRPAIIRAALDRSEVRA